MLKFVPFTASHKAGDIPSLSVRDAIHSRVDRSVVVPSSLYSMRTWSRCVTCGEIVIAVRDFCLLVMELKLFPNLFVAHCAECISWYLRAIPRPVMIGSNAWLNGVTCFSPRGIVRCGVS